MNLRHRLTAALLVLLMLFGGALLLHIWASGARGRADNALRIAVEQRQGLGTLRQQLLNRQQRVELLGRITAGGTLPQVRPEAVEQLQSDLAAFERRIATLSRSGATTAARGRQGGGDDWRRHYADLVTSYRTLAAIWQTFYRDLALRTAEEDRSDPGGSSAPGPPAAVEPTPADPAAIEQQTPPEDPALLLVATMTARADERLQPVLAALSELELLAEAQVDAALEEADRAAISTDRMMLGALAVAALLAAAVAIILPGLLLGRLQRFRAAVEELAQAAGGWSSTGQAAPGGETGSSAVAEGELGRAARAVELLAAELAAARAAEGEGRSRLATARREGDALIADLAAQMRPPVDSIVGQCERMIQQAELDGHQQAVPELHRILQTGRHHLALLDGIADLARADAGEMELDLERFEVAPLVDQLATAVGPLAAKRDNRLELDVDGEVAEMYSDPTKLRQILFHLLSHCCSTTEGGSVVLQVRRLTAPGVDWLRFEISDTGPGIPPHQRRRLFAGLEAGLGLQGPEGSVPRLGLAVARRFCQLMGGEIEVQGEPGQGTVFVAALPAEVPAAARDRAAGDRGAAVSGAAVPGAALAEPRPGAPGLLLASDDSHLLASIRRRQEAAGWQVAEAADLGTALRQLSLLRPTALLVDLALGAPANEQPAEALPVEDDGAAADGATLDRATASAAAEELWRALADTKASAVTAGTAVVLLYRVGRSYLLLGTLEQLVRPIDRERAVACLARLRRGQPHEALVAVTELAARELLVRGLSRDGWRVDEEEADELTAVLLERRPAVVIELTRTKESSSGATVGIAETLQPATSSFLVRSVIAGGVPVADRLLLLTGPLPEDEDRRLRRALDRLGEEHGQEGQQLLDSLAGLLDRLAAPVSEVRAGGGDPTIGSSTLTGDSGGLPGGLQTSTVSGTASSSAAGGDDPSSSAPAVARPGDELGTILADLDFLDGLPADPGAQK